MDSERLCTRQKYELPSEIKNSDEESKSNTNSEEEKLPEDEDLEELYGYQNNDVDHEISIEHNQPISQIDAGFLSPPTNDTPLHESSFESQSLQPRDRLPGINNHDLSSPHIFTGYECHDNIIVDGFIVKSTSIPEKKRSLELILTVISVIFLIGVIIYGTIDLKNN